MICCGSWSSLLPPITIQVATPLEGTELDVTSDAFHNRFNQLWMNTSELYSYSGCIYLLSRTMPNSLQSTRPCYPSSIQAAPPVQIQLWAILQYWVSRATPIGIRQVGSFLIFMKPDPTQHHFPQLQEGQFPFDLNLRTNPRRKAYPRCSRRTPNHSLSILRGTLR
jgi:hypothetical protein